jgi:hypothetical protein
MVETLLTVGEQEALALNTNLKRENLDLKQILARLQQAEFAQGLCPPARLSFPPLSNHASPLSASALFVPLQHACAPSVVFNPHSRGLGGGRMNALMLCWVGDRSGGNLQLGWDVVGCSAL